MKTDELSYREITLNSRQLEVPREAYQRELNTASEGELPERSLLCV